MDLSAVAAVLFPVIRDFPYGRARDDHRLIPIKSSPSFRDSQENSAQEFPKNSGGSLASAKTSSGTYEDGRQATAVFQAHKDDIVCVLIDLTTPHVGGEETYAELRRIREDVQVILISGYSEVELEERFKDLGVGGFLKKPVKRRKLLDKLREVLGCE